MAKKSDSSALDTHNRMNAIELERLISRQAKAIMADPGLSHKIPPIMVHGAPGCGKSTIIKTIAKELGIGFIDMRLSQMEPIDLRGIPVPNHEAKSAEWYITSDLPRDPKSYGILLFDEITAADKSLQVAAYELILDRRLGELYSIPDGWLIVGAGNRTEDRAVSCTMSSALANRFLHVELKEDAEAWIDWARQHDIHPSVIGFIMYRPTMLFSMDDGENLERGWPSPRSWERVSHMVQMYGHEDEQLLRKIVYGLVGNSAGVEFMEFFKLDREFDNVLETMRNPAKPINIPMEADRKYALASAINYLLWKGADADDEAKRINGFFRYTMEFTPDFASMMMMAAMQGDKKSNDRTYCEKLYHHPSYRDWQKKHGAALAKRFANKSYLKGPSGL